MLIHTQTTTISWRRTLALPSAGLPSAGLQHWGCARETLVCIEKTARETLVCIRKTATRCDTNGGETKRVLMMMMFITITARD